MLHASWQWGRAAIIRICATEMKKILKVHNVNDYAQYIGAPQLHPLVSVIHYDELEHCRHSLNNYDVFGIFIGDETLEKTYLRAYHLRPSPPRPDVCGTRPDRRQGRHGRRDTDQGVGAALRPGAAARHRPRAQDVKTADRLMTMTTEQLILACLVVINVVTFFTYGIDKWKARHSKWRISEATLLGLAVIGGSIGAWLGMKVWHHKTLHQKFRYGIPLILAAQVVIVLLASR